MILIKTNIALMLKLPSESSFNFYNIGLVSGMLFWQNMNVPFFYGNVCREYDYRARCYEFAHAEWLVNELL